MENAQTLIMGAVSGHVGNKIADAIEEIVGIKSNHVRNLENERSRISENLPKR